MGDVLRSGRLPLKQGASGTHPAQEGDVAREKALPFEPLVPNEETIEAMKEARRGGLKSAVSVEALMADLHADD